MDPINLDALALWHFSPDVKRHKSPAARILLIHGLGEHHARHSNTIQALLENGYEVVTFDLRGSGRSGGRRQWVESFDNYAEDTAHVFHWIQRELPPKPLFVLGHSLGGAVATHFVPHYQKRIKGLVLSAPAYLVGTGISALKIAVGRMLTRLAPKLRIPGATDYSTLSRDPEVGKAYLADPLACHFNTIQQGDQILKALEAMPELAARIEIPTLFVHGTADRVIRLEGSFALLQKIASNDKEMFLIPGGYHEPHNDWDKEIYFTRLKQWLGHRVNG